MAYTLESCMDMLQGRWPWKMEIIQVRQYREALDGLNPEKLGLVISNLAENSKARPTIKEIVSSYRELIDKNTKTETHRHHVPFSQKVRDMCRSAESKIRSMPELETIPSDMAKIWFVNHVMAVAEIQAQEILDPTERKWSNCFAACGIGTWGGSGKNVDRLLRIWRREASKAGRLTLEYAGEALKYFQAMQPEALSRKTHRDKPKSVISGGYQKTKTEKETLEELKQPI